jgi:hypothetical protein
LSFEGGLVFNEIPWLEAVRKLVGNFSRRTTIRIVLVLVLIPIIYRRLNVNESTKIFACEIHLVLPIDPISLNFFRYIIALLSGIHLFGICLGATGIYYRLRDGGGKYKRIKPCEYVGRLGKSTPKLERRVLGPCLITDLPDAESLPEDELQLAMW